MQVYLDRKAELKKVLKNCQLCLTIDTWTSIQNLNYMSLTAHWIDNDWKLQKRIINFCTVPDHKGDTLGERIEECLLEWGIDRIFTITVDNASANDKLIRYIKRVTRYWETTILDNEFLHVRFSAHIVKLIVKSGLEEHNESIDRIKTTVRFVRSSPARLDVFKKCAEKEKISSKSLLSLDIETRWNSTYLMLESALIFEKAFARLAKDNKQFSAYFGENGFPPHVLDWENARHILCFLKLFYNVTVRLSASLHVTANSFFHELILIRTKLIQLAEGSDCTLAAMAARMKVKFDKYWEVSNNLNYVLFIAIILDPRYEMKYLQFCLSRLFELAKTIELGDKIQETLNRLFDSYVESAACSFGNRGSSHVLHPINVDEHEDNPCGLLASQFAEHLEEIESRETNSELSRYLAENCEKITTGKFDILSWWRGNSNKYPILSSIAKDVLGVPVSTVASESAFSTGERILSPFRSSLTPSMVEAVVCSQSWIHSEPSEVDIREAVKEAQSYDEIEQDLLAKGKMDK